MDIAGLPAACGAACGARPLRTMPDCPRGAQRCPELPRWHPAGLEVARFISARAEDRLRACGATETWTRLPGSGVSGGQHQAGTCRMGNDPKTAVVDRDCRGSHGESRDLPT